MDNWLQHYANRNGTLNYVDPAGSAATTKLDWSSNSTDPAHKYDMPTPHPMDNGINWTHTQYNPKYYDWRKEYESLDSRPQYGGFKDNPSNYTPEEAKRGMDLKSQGQQQGWLPWDDQGNFIKNALKEIFLNPASLAALGGYAAFAAGGGAAAGASGTTSEVAAGTEAGGASMATEAAGGAGVSGYGGTGWSAGAAGAGGAGTGTAAAGEGWSAGGSGSGGGEGGSGFSMDGGLNASTEPANAGMSAENGSQAYSGQINAANNTGNYYGSAMGSGAGAAAVGGAGAGAAGGAGAGAGAAGGGLFGTGVSAGTALGVAGLVNNWYQSDRDRKLANESSDKANTLAQPQRQPYQDLLSQYFNGRQDITEQPIFANALDLMNRQSTARMAAQQQTGNQGAMAQEFNKNATQQLNASALPYLSQLSGQAGFGFPANGMSGQLYGQYNNAGNQQVSNGLYNLGGLAGLYSAAGNNTSQQQQGNNNNYWPGYNGSSNNNSSGSGNGSLSGEQVYSRA